MSDEDEGKWQALRNELSQPDRSLPNVYDGADVVEREEPEPDAFAGENIYSAHDESEDKPDDIFKPYRDGYLRKHRDAE